ncbi:hypothetical protein OROHE_009290 [Orobanche hederae]
MELPFSQSRVRVVQESVDFVNETWVPETMPDSWIPCSPAPTPEGFESLYSVHLGDEGWTTTSTAAHSLAAEILQPETEPPEAEMTGEEEMSPSMRRFLSDACYSTPCCYVLARISGMSSLGTAASF